MSKLEELVESLKSTGGMYTIHEIFEIILEKLESIEEIVEQLSDIVYDRDTMDE